METAESVQERVQVELERISDPILLARTRELLIAPYPEMRPWDYGAPHEYLCWRVLEHRLSNTGVVFCSKGFGPSTPWGLVWLDESPDSPRRMGPDSSWFATLEQAVRDSWAWEGSPR